MLVSDIAVPESYIVLLLCMYIYDEGLCRNVLKGEVCS